MDIGAWLRGLGLGRYEPAFRDNGVDVDVLPDLTDADLKELGLTLGDRKRLLKAIADLRTPSPGSAETPAASSPAPAASPTSQAERRQLTVMFVDLVGSTALSARLDPEDLRELIGAYHRCVAATVERFAGYVAKYMGDGVLAYFGWPQAHEDDAERAVRAGLAVVAAVAGLKAPSGEPLAARVGIATGLVVVGDLLGEGAAREEAVVGETPNLAARLQEQAGPGTVVVAEATRRLVGELFEVEDLGLQPLKGFAGPVRAFRVAGEGAAEGRFEARAGGRLLPLVGRAAELALLLERWARARAGEGQVVLLSGEPGIGKSRLVRAVRDELQGEPHTPLRYQGSPHHGNSALHPVIAQLERAAGLARDDPAAARLAKLEALLARGTADVAAAAPLIADLLGLDARGRWPPLELSPPQKKVRTFQVLLEQLAGLAAQRPVLEVVEDAHWLDPTTTELLGLVVERIRTLPALLLVTFRPERPPPWAGHAHLTTLTLDRLGRGQVPALVAGLTGGKALPAEVLEQIVARTDGVPLFVEELTRTVLESGLLREGAGGFALAGPLPPLAIPSTLHDSLMARLDRLAPVKEVAQVAACLGREFSFELLAATAPLADSELRDALQQLVAAELIFARGAPPDATYTFKHALVRDAAYQSLLKSKRQRLHARIAEVLETRFPESVATEPEVLAHHLTLAGLHERAVGWWLEAGRRAKARHANREATSHLTACLEAVRKAGAGAAESCPELADVQTEALVGLGDLASLNENLTAADEHYRTALKAASNSDLRRRIESKRHHPRWVTRDGSKIVFYEHGSGDITLLFVSTQAVGLATFQPILERLCDEFRIVTVEPRGSGGSAPLARPYPLGEHVADVRAVIDALGAPPRLVGVGISMGANLLFRIAHAAPGLLRGIVTVGAPIAGHRRPFFPDDWLRLQEEARRTLEVEPLLRLHVQHVFSEPEMREMLDTIVRTRLRLPRQTLLSFFLDDKEDDVTSLLPEIATPTLVTHGRNDRLVSFAAAELTASSLPDARLHGFEGKGHLPIFTATHEFCEVLRSFVGDTLRRFDRL